MAIENSFLIKVKRTERLRNHTNFEKKGYSFKRSSILIKY